MSTYPILIVDDNKLFRQGLRVLLNQSEDIVIVGDVDVADALDHIVTHNPQIIFIDMRHPTVDDGIRLIGRIRETMEEARIIALLESRPESNEVYRILYNGAIGCLLEGSSGIDEVKEAIRKVGQGQPFLSSAALTSLMQSMAKHDEPPASPPPNRLEGLSLREREVLAWVARGNSNREIAHQLVISESTVRTHLQHIFDKLELVNRFQVAAFALRTGLRGPADDTDIPNARTVFSNK